MEEPLDEWLLIDHNDAAHTAGPVALPVARPRMRVIRPYGLATLILSAPRSWTWTRVAQVRFMVRGLINLVTMCLCTPGLSWTMQVRMTILLVSWYTGYDAPLLGTVIFMLYAGGSPAYLPW